MAEPISNLLIERLELHNAQILIDPRKRLPGQSLDVVDGAFGLQHDSSGKHRFILLDRTIGAQRSLRQRSEIHRMILPANIGVYGVLHDANDFEVRSRFSPRRAEMLS